MTAEALASITSVTVIAVQLVKWGCPSVAGGLALAVVGGISLLLCVLWALSSGLPLAPEQAYPFAAAWITVMSSASGIYGFVARPLRESRPNGEQEG